MNQKPLDRVNRETHKRHFLYSILLPSVITVLLIGATIFFYIVPYFEDKLIESKKEMILELTQTAFSSLNYYVSLEQTGKIPRREAQRLAMEHLRQMRYGDKLQDYFWITDRLSRLVMHPVIADLEGENISSYMDQNGKQLNAAILNIVNERGSGFLEYLWHWKHSPTRIVPKVSFIKLFEPWDWIVGTGLYLDDVKSDIRLINSRLIASLTAILSIVALLAGIFIFQALKMERQKTYAWNAHEKSEFKYRELVQNANSIILRLDVRGRVSFINEYAQRFFGFTAAELLGQKAVGRIIPEIDSSGQNIAQMIEQLMHQPEQFVSNENENIRKDGSRVWISWTNKAIRDDGGNVVEILCIGNDITARKASDEALRVSEEKFRNIINSTPMGIHLYKLEPDGKLFFTGANQAADTILNIDNNRCIGKTIEEAFPPLIDTDVPARYRKVCDTGEPWQTEQIYYEDELIKGAFEVHAFQTSPGKMAAIFSDITERKKAEEKIKESEERFRILFEHAPDPYYIIDLNGTLVDGNHAAEKFTGYEKEELIGRNIAEIELLLDEDLAKALSQLEKNQRDEPTGPDEYKLSHKNGATLEAEISTHPVAIMGRKYVLGIARDITARKRAEEETRKLGAQLRQAQKMESIGTLAGGIAHDFNNILSAVIGYSEMALDKTAEGGPLQEYLQEVKTAGHRARDLVKQILAFSRQAEQEVKPVQVRLIAKEVTKLLKASLPATIEIRQNFESESAVLMDPTQIHQVLMNLCTNAGHAMREHGGVLTIGLRDKNFDAETVAAYAGLEPGRHLKLSVGDTGEGMPAEVADRIFDPFFTTKEKGVGTGLGLSVVHGIVTGSQGKITVESVPGKGTVLHVYLPVVERMAARQIDATGSLAFGSERILFVDDEKPIADLGKGMLERCGYAVTTRTSSVEALQLFKAHPEKFDLVITDLTMPNMTGKELTREILRIRPETPVILCTGFSVRITEETAKAMGIRAFLMKPLAMFDFARTVRQVLDEGRCR